MEIFIFIVWVMFALIIPIVLIQTSFSQYSKQIGVFRTTVRLIIAIVVYAFLTVITLLNNAMMMFAGMYKNEKGQSLSLEDILFSSAVVIVYGIAGWLLCSLTNRSLIKASTISNWLSRKPQSIFNP
ncbi:MAG: hypothetical protein M3033_10780 [Acidobacteriota bacterium]|nr:hypothetical protein [Acidobacteriota bacterium]